MFRLSNETEVLQNSTSAAVAILFCSITLCFPIYCSLLFEGFASLLNLNAVYSHGTAGLEMNSSL